MKDSRKILITFNFWKGDKAQTMRAARFLADIEPTMCSNADMLFVCRPDCTQDEETVQYVSKKFHVYTATSRRSEVGWPQGCNGLFFGTADFIYEQRAAKKLPDYKAFLIFEGDSCPLVPDWIQKLSDAWDAANTSVLGPLIKSPPVHINGNALYSGDMKFLQYLSRKISGCSPCIGYDVFLYTALKKWGLKDCPIMRSHWHCPSMTPQVFRLLRSQGVVFLHGVKDESMMNVYWELTTV